MNLWLLSPERTGLPPAAFNSTKEQSAAPAIRLAALMPLHQNDRSNDHDRRADKAEWL